MESKSCSVSCSSLPLLLTLFILCLNCNSSTEARVVLHRVHIFSTSNNVESNSVLSAKIAISESLAGAKNASATVSNLADSGGLEPKEAAAVKDCLVTAEDAVQELKRSLEAMKRVGSDKNLGSQVSNAHTWVSAALTDENTCMDGFADSSTDGEAKRIIRGEIVKVAKLIGNALSIIGRLE